MEIILFVSIIISFILTIVVLPKWIRKCKQTGLLWEDMNKYTHPKNVAGSGGIVVVMAFILGVLSYIAIRTFLIINQNGITTQIFSLLTVVLILSIVGLTDDLLGWKHGGLSAKIRIFLALIASIPLVVINAGSQTIMLPWIGTINLGLFYTLIILPLGVAGATTAFNFLAGFNGLETGQGIIILTFLSFISYITGTTWLALIGLIMVSSLIAFYFYNRFPARVFPGDILTYSVGALIVTMAILGNFEKITIFIFIPYIIEGILKARGGLKKQSFAIPDKYGNLKLPYKKVYSLTHLSILILSKFKRNVRERDVTYLIFIFQVLICLIALVLFKKVLYI